MPAKSEENPNTHLILHERIFILSSKYIQKEVQLLLICIWELH